MREVSGSTWVFQIMIIFILIFACFLCLVINYSKAYQVKNEMLSIIEEYEGVSSTSEEIINNYLQGNAYLAVGECPAEWYGVRLSDGGYEEADGQTKYNYCFIEYQNPNKQVYYEIIVFYKFNLPFFGDLMTFRVNGVTNSFVGSSNRY